jgi:tetratricopeptide (TPR) repeat protein
MDLPRIASAPQTGDSNTDTTSSSDSADGTPLSTVPTIFNEDEMTYYHLAFGARKINDHKTVIKTLKLLYDLIRKNANDDAKKANERFGYFFSWLGDAYDQSGNALMATRCYQRFLEQFPLSSSNLKTTVAVANNLTWLLATHIDPEIRAPDVAIQYATELEKHADLPEPCHDTIAVAYGAVGRFKEALLKLDAIASSTRDPNLLRVLSQHRKLFQKNTPYIEDPKPGRP